MFTPLKDIKSLDYPIYSIERASEIKKSLFEKGINEIYSFGKKEIGIDRAIGKGVTSIVFLGSYKDKKAIIKIERSDSRRRGSIKKEAFFLSKANEKGVGPKIYESGENYIIMEFIEGPLLIERKFDKNDIFDIARQCHLLDILGIDHRQIQGGKHIICADRNVIIDFEKAHYSKTPRNLTSFLSMCFLSDCLIRERIKELFQYDDDLIKTLLKEYKANYNIDELISKIQ